VPRSRAVIAAFALLVCLTVAALAAVGAELALAYREPVATRADWKAEANAALVARFYAEVWTGGGLTYLAEYVADDHAYHDPAVPAAPAGPAGVAQAVAGLRRAFPDLTLTLDDAVATGDQVAVRFTVRGTHRGTFLGAEATGRAVTATGFAVHRLDAGQVAETWVGWDTFDLAQQIGLVLLPVSALGGSDGWEGAPAQTQPGEPY
jgi:steroid delta-isomerase-like uncharacterized protein